MVTGMTRDSMLMGYVNSRRSPLTIAAINCESYSSISRNSPTLAPRGPDNTRPSGSWISTDERGGTRLIFSFILLLSAHHCFRPPSEQNQFLTIAFLACAQILPAEFLWPLMPLESQSMPYSQ